jgi:large subunit ribosomal protein L19
VVIEKIYPLSFAKFAKVLLLDEYRVRRAKIYYIRDKVGKGARMKSRITSDRR